MVVINVRSLRGRISEILDRVQAGEEVVILRKGQAAERIIPPANGSVVFQSRQALRDGLPPMQESAGFLMRHLRDDERD